MKYLIVAIYDSGVEFDVYANDRKLSNKQKLTIKKHYEQMIYYSNYFTNYLMKYYGKRYDEVIIVDNGYIAVLKGGK